MRTRNAVVGAAVALALVALALGRAAAQDEGGESGEGQGGAMGMPAWMMPTGEHKELLDSCGTFDVKGEMWMAPGAPPQPFTATAVREAILGGKYVRETFHSTFAGMPLEGMLLQGYDTVRGQYVTIWMDNFSPVPSIGYGEKAEDGSLVSWSEDPDPGSGELKKTKSVTRGLEDGTVQMEQFDVASDGTETKAMRLVYTAAGE